MIFVRRAFVPFFLMLKSPIHDLALFYDLEWVPDAAGSRRLFDLPDETTEIEAMQRGVPKAVGESFALVEREMLKGPWVMGERYTICDPYLFTLAQWLEADGVDPATIPRVIDHRRRMSDRATVKKAIAEELA